MGKFEIKTAKDGQNYFNLKAGNGEIILSSEMYTTMKACENGIASVKKNAPLEARYDLKQSENGKWHFNLKAGNHQVIGSSQMYASEDSAKNGIESVMKNAPEAEVVVIEAETAPAKEEAPEAEAAEAPKAEVAEAPKAEAPKAEKKNTPAAARLNASIAPEDFDWDAFEGGDIYGGAEKSNIEAAYNQTLSKVIENEVVEGEVTLVNKREVVVTIGGKSEGVIPVSEFRYNPDIKEGDKVEVYVENAEDKKGQLVLSHRKARALKSWDRVNEAYENDEIVKGFVKTRTKGGMIVDVFGIEAFLPGSQIDIKPIRDYDAFVNQNIDFKIVKINQEFRNVVVSHKALLEAEQEQKRAELIGKLEKGQVLEGVVKNITNYGVFIDLGGVDGLIHITDLSWGRINNPEEVVKLDEKIKVVILDFDEGKKRIALGLKQLTPHPWDALDAELKVGDSVKGKVVVIADYGAFVEIAPGVEGLIHVSEMSWSQHLRTAQDFLKVGDEVEAQILTLDREERKMSLGMKQLMPDPWANIAERYPINSKHTATVRNFTNFGIFVELEEGVDGLIHISDLSWSKKIKHPAEFTKVGETIDVVVLDVDQENRRLSLGHKQLEENPWDVFEGVFTLGSMHQGTVISASDKGVVVSLPYGVEGFCPSRYMKKEDGTNAKVEDVLDFKVLEFNKEIKRIVLALPKVETEKEPKSSEEKAADKAAKQAKRAVKQINDTIERSTLGDLDVLAGLKENLEKQEKAAKENGAE